MRKRPQVIQAKPVEFIHLELEPGLHVPELLPFTIYVTGDKPVKMTIHYKDQRVVLMSLQS